MKYIMPKGKEDTFCHEHSPCEFDKYAFYNVYGWQNFSANGSIPMIA